MQRHKPSVGGVGHNISKLNARDPHAGPTPGDASFRFYFPTPEAYMSAMKLAAALEAKGLHRRAWRVRLNLDGEQPRYAPIINRDEDDEGKSPPPPPPLPPPPNPLKARNGRVTLALDPEHREAVQRLIKQSQLSHAKLAKAIGMSQQAVSSWAKGDYISEESYELLRKFVEGMRK